MFTINKAVPVCSIYKFTRILDRDPCAVVYIISLSSMKRHIYVYMSCSSDRCSRINHGEAITRLILFSCINHLITPLVAAHAGRSGQRSTMKQGHVVAQLHHLLNNLPSLSTGFAGYAIFNAPYQKIVQS
jgi:hypothetical protein